MRAASLKQRFLEHMRKIMFFNADGQTASTL